MTAVFFSAFNLETLTGKVAAPSIVIPERERGCRSRATFQIYIVFGMALLILGEAFD